MSKQSGTVHICLCMTYDLPVADVELALAAKKPDRRLVEIIKLLVPTDDRLAEFQVESVRKEFGEYLAEKRIAELRQLPEHSSAEPEMENA
jgi:hypothetical protein